MRYLILALFLVPFVSADYLAAVSEDAPASDVVFAANFASYMKQVEGVDFSGVIDRDVYNDETPASLADDSIVFIDGQKEHALYVIGSDTGSKHRAVAESAIDYLQGEGFEVDQTTSDELTQSELLVGGKKEAEREEAPQPQETERYDEDNEQDSEEDTEQQPVITPVNPQQPVIPEVREEPRNTSAPLNDLAVKQEKPSVFGRITSWFRGLFS